MYINIKTIVDKGDSFERSFQEWLNENDVPWQQKGANLNLLWLDEKDDYEFVREIWPEVKKW